MVGMSDQDSSRIGGKPAESPKNPKVYGVPVKIDPYTSVRTDHSLGTSGSPSAPKKKDERPFDPFGVVIESPTGGD